MLTTMKMQQFFFICLALVLMGSGCTYPSLDPINNLPDNGVESQDLNSYTSSKLGVKVLLNDFYKREVRESGSRIYSGDKDAAFESGNYVQVFDTDVPKKVIQALINENGLNPTNCEIIDESYSEDIKQFRVQMIDKNIVYTPDELQEMEEADSASSKDGGPFDRTSVEARILKTKQMEQCSDFAEDRDFATCTSIPSSFAYYPDHNKMLFFPTTTCDAPFYRSFEFL